MKLLLLLLFVATGIAYLLGRLHGARKFEELFLDMMEERGYELVKKD